MDKKLNNPRKFDPHEINNIPYSKTATDNTIQHKHTL